MLTKHVKYQKKIISFYYEFFIVKTVTKELYMIWVKFDPNNSQFFKCFGYNKMLCYVLEKLMKNIFFTYLFHLFAVTGSI